MKIKMGKRSLTFMIIPDANRKVVRFRVSVLLLYLLPIILLSGLCVTLFVHMNNLQTEIEKQQLASELANKTAQYEQTLTNKDYTINELQSEIIDISSQTDEMKSKVDELKKLEQEIRDVTGTASASSAAAGGGGPTIELEADDTEHLIADTKERLTQLDMEVGTLLMDISSAKEDLIEHLRVLRITPSMWPTVSERITSTFGYRKDPFTRRAAFHSGLDIAGDSGDPIYASAEGVVKYAGYDSDYGYNVIIKHASGVSTRYGHMRKYLVKEGQKVAQGEKVGLLGSTGRSTGPHLHFEVIKSGNTIDPMPYLKTAGKD